MGVINSILSYVFQDNYLWYYYRRFHPIPIWPLLVSHKKTQNGRICKKGDCIESR